MPPIFIFVIYQATTYGIHAMKYIDKRANQVIRSNLVLV